MEEKSQKDIKIGLENNEKRLIEIKGKRENLYIEHARLKASMEASQERRETAQKRLLEIETTIREMSGLRLKREEEINSGRQKIEQLSTTIVNIGNREDQYEIEKRNLEHEENSIESEIGKMSSEIKDVEDKIDATRKKSEQIVESFSKTEVVLTEQRIKSQTEEDRIWEKYEVHLSDMLIDLSQNAEMDRIQIDKLKAKITNIGPVNLVAIDEFNSLKERYDLLSAQHKDLIDSSASLAKVIKRINETTELMFLETFEKIRQHFKAMFSKLLGGGKADLKLLDDREVLECGIDIIASPPGKKLQSISLLSGGERSLTALALLLAMFRVKPSPFCLLDEIDAALDDANTKRFTEILKDFSEKSQFIIVTHNKKTIGMAEVIYGVTMEESGVSKIVSVKFVGEQQPLMEGTLAS